MLTLGIDIGSTTSKCVLLEDGERIVASSLRVGGLGTEGPEEALQDLRKQYDYKDTEIAKTIVTGYGRNKYEGADGEVSELTCHALGGRFIFPDLRTVIDIGGQDAKIITLGESGRMSNFVMNDKCAAGTGRFLEMMARTLEISIDELGPASLQARENITISSMCSVFAESEVISLIAQNKETADIAHGIHMAIAGKALSLLRRVGLEPGFMMTGGVAKNPGLVKVLEHQLGAPLYIYEEPEIVGAIGAALCAFED